MAARRKAPKPAPDIAELAARARAVLEEAGAVPKSKLGPPAVRADVAARLEAEGFELTPKVVRRPLNVQLRDALARGAAIPFKSAARHVAGATNPEAQKAAHGLLRAEEAHLVLRGTALTLLPRSAAVLSAQSLRKLLELAKLAQAAAKAKEGATLLESDVRELVSAVLPATRPKQTSLERVLEAVAAAHDPNVGLSFVPKVVKSLDGELGADTAKSALIEAADRGLLELRPEGGMGRLSVDELELCPPGPQGTRLSWVRLRGRSETMSGASS